MPFQPGQSGNPAGRPKKGDALADLLDKAWPTEHRIAVITSLVETAMSDRKDAVKAAELLLAYAYGKPRQAIELSGEDGEKLQIIVTYADPQSDPAAPPSGPAPDSEGGAAL